MRRIRLNLEYDGTAYAGWQRQENALAVQEVLEKALRRLTKEEIRVTGASRTDAGVKEGEALLRQYGQSLHADYVQMAHHGQNGVSLEVYRAINPSACLWSTPDWLWQNDSGTGYGSGPWKTFSVRCFMQDLGVNRHFVAKDGVWEIPLGDD